MRLWPPALGRRDLLLAALPGVLSTALLLAAFAPAQRTLANPNNSWTAYSYDSLLNRVHLYALAQRDPRATPEQVQARRDQALSSLSSRAAMENEFQELPTLEAEAGYRMEELRDLLRRGRPADTAEALAIAQALNAAAHIRLNELRGELLRTLKLIKTTVVLTALLTGLISTLLIARALAGARQAQHARQAREAQHKEALGMAAHELRRPLQALLLATDALRGQDNLRAREKLLRIIEEQAAFLAARTELERLDGMYVNISPRPQSTDLAALLTGLESERVRLRRPAGPVNWTVDGAQVRQVVENLVENALRYSAGPVLVVLCAPTEAGGPQIRVLDRGPGLPPEQREAVFDPGHQRPRVASGRGLGLPLARRLARANGADLTLHEAQGGGLEARVEFGRR
ncbi:sensor histidine kinase [Deinococcus arcticus]|uniref:histidine kinase n=1 Tax=Deinococcus arcticus TaxID=2136176 RepID=A0A2T3W7Y2_9DEIO|nr:HAMP domain-containing sensor histidine kinase [Deinococcus arcticus]PTA68021.1 sensor histidine kinase [Deinococcus arcticus]